MLLAKKAIGKLRRRFVSLPENGQIEAMKGGLRFEHKRLSFLDDGDLRAMLTHSYDIILCDYLKRNLSVGDTVLDVGANVGYISAVAASCVGVTGEVHGFEPLAECYARLLRLQELNPGFRLKFNNIALGETEGSLSIGFNPEGDSRNASLVPGIVAPESRQVPVKRLDDYVFANVSAPERIRLIKIDVEGFEYPVLRGLGKFLAKFQPLIVCEVKPWTLKNFGATPADFDRYMAGFGYQSFLITDDERPVGVADLDDMEVLVFRAKPR